MDTLTLVIVLAVLGVAVLVGGGLALTRGRRSKAPLPPLTELDERPGERPADRSGDVRLLEPDTVAEPAVEAPEPVAGRMARLRARLGRSQGALGAGLLGLLSRERLDEQTWEEVEDVLLAADVGVGPTQELVERLRTRVKELGRPDEDAVRTLLREELLALVGPTEDRALRTQGRDGRPAVVLVVGVNGTGKTTTVGKLARVLVAERRRVLLGAADTFRAAAADQLTTWGERVGAPVVRGPEGGDPASVAFDAVQQGGAGGYDVVLVDTAGRLQNKVGLMDELGKVKRVVETARTGRRGPARARRHDRPERPDPGPGVRRGRRRHGHRAHQARRHRQGRHRRGRPARARRARQAGRAGRGRRRPGAVRPGGLRRRAARHGCALAVPAGLPGDRPAPARRPVLGHPGGMAERREPSETERLLAEVDGMLTGAATGPDARPVPRPAGPERWPATVVGRLRTALLVGAVSGAGVWLLFAVLPFLRATSGAVGAFLAATAATLLFRRRR